ncbi:OPT family oligopeptide transporter [Corynebacterium sp. HS2168-gen11]|uniref:OPT family oligopeptide transporter n=1 Tax=Corynebacterium sp. HS2168-gen11 TaxID=2974027 RepID=UPI00216AEA79|nr:oligopeptide transporter, OPT family [Corynebacterium sp. HS2168-gen11]MCS4535587.1 oligopeptide transporter, OPT family [Corynebacterium sp. HS2168-gen11]
MSAIATSSATSNVRELTLRGIILGGLITLVFTAANVYLGLKVGLTFATSIPAAVISMAILRKFRDHSVVENNIVQTIASAAGTLSAIIFVLPGLVMIGFWTGFPYWTTVAVCAIGGVLGVMYSIPLRRAMVTGSDLPYPEGVAAAEVLKVGDDNADPQALAENQKGLKVIILGGLASAGFSLLAAMRAVAGSVSYPFKIFGGGTMIGSSLSLALIGVGHLVGVGVGIAMIVGLLISYGVLLPIFSADQIQSGEELSAIIGSTFSGEVRFIGAGTMAVAAVWTLLKIIVPIAKGIKDSLTSTQKRAAGETVPLTERDIPFTIVIGVILASMLPIGALLYLFVHVSEIAHHTTALILLSVVFVLLIGLIVASVCGYMAGLIGASNSPISGVGIIVVLSSALLIKAVTGNESATNAPALVAYTLFTSAVVFGIATISNDNLQDLKTGQLVGATPWKQQVALVIGVLFGSLIIPPVLQLMLTGFGFVGMEGAGENALAAPQASLLSSVANGIFGNSLDWSLIGLGAAIGVVVIIIDEVLRKSSGDTRFLPPLAVGMGMYLPISLTLIIPIGAFIGSFYNKWAERQTNPEFATRMGTLLATGLIVGESLFGVLNAGIIGAAGREDALALFDFGVASEFIGVIGFAATIAFLYRWARSLH